jgi:hypothetical protein
MSRGVLVGATFLGSATLASVCAAAVAGALGAGSPLSQPSNVADIPASYLAAYQSAAKRAQLGEDGWSYLAGIGKVESDHGRSIAAGVHSGQNSNGCCAGPMQIDNGGGSGKGTWGAYRVDGDGDGRADIYDEDDAVATAAQYLRVSGAPADWRRALFAYNHAGWYVDRVTRQAAAYRLALSSPSTTTVPRAEGEWLAPLPGFPGERCDRRIVADVTYLVGAYDLRVTDCFGGQPHELGGEHPLGLALDVVPANGNWDRTKRLATDFGWSPACARAGCPNRGAFRVVLYNGFPGHGDPRYSAHPHLHLSWNHGPASAFSAAPWVRTLLPAGASR